MKKSKESLDLARQRYAALQSLTKQNGWQYIEQILRDEFHKAIDQVSNPKSVKAEVEARGIIKFIKKLTDSINSEMQFGKLAQEEYVQQYITPDGERKSA